MDRCNVVRITPGRKCKDIDMMDLDQGDVFYIEYRDNEIDTDKYGRFLMVATNNPRKIHPEHGYAYVQVSYIGEKIC